MKDWPPDKPMRWVRKGQWNAILASHNPFACLFGDRPCIHIYGLTEPEKKRLRAGGHKAYPLVHQRNLPTVLKHEGLHCALQQLFGFDDVDDFDTLDKIISNVAGTRRLLEAA